jgi:hypothetical protein
VRLRRRDVHRQLSGSVRAHRARAASARKRHRAGRGTAFPRTGGCPRFVAGSALPFRRPFSYGAVGWSTATSAGEVTNRILDPSARGVFIHGGAPLPGEDGRTDDEIVVDFARALGRDPVAGSLLGPVDRRYLAGWSDSSETVKRIVDSGLADGVFELALPITTDQPFDPQDALAAGSYHGKVITLDSDRSRAGLAGAEVLVACEVILVSTRRRERRLRSKVLSQDALRSVRVAEGRLPLLHRDEEETCGFAAT